MSGETLTQAGLASSKDREVEARRYIRQQMIQLAVTLRPAASQPEDIVAFAKVLEDYIVPIEFHRVRAMVHRHPAR